MNFQPILAIAQLTWKAAVRFRLFVVVTALLLAVVVLLPMLIKDDGTARGFTQILLTYTLTGITGLLGLSTLWLSCGTLARDIEECQIQMVVVKPVPRWQVWVGKWLGIVSLNAALLAISGASVFLLLQWRATRLPEAEQRILRSQVLVSRGSAKPADPSADIEARVNEELRKQLADHPVRNVNLPEVKRQIRERVTAEFQVVPSKAFRWWNVDLSAVQDKIQGKPLHLRIKFNSARPSASGTFEGVWQVGDPDSPNVWQSEPMSLAPDTYHEFEIPADLCTPKGELIIMFLNPSDVTLLFPLEDGIEVLYSEGSFLLNYIRALFIIFCWMALFASLGLAAASFLSFPVAAFLSVAMLVLALSTSTMADVVKTGTIMGFNEETGKLGSSILDWVAVPAFRMILGAINLAKDFSPVDSLGTGRSITWMTVARAIGQIVLLLGGLCAAFGIFIFNRRELATAQGTQ